MELVKILKPTAVYSETPLSIAYEEHYRVFEIHAGDVTTKYLVYVYGDTCDAREAYEHKR